MGIPAGDGKRRRDVGIKKVPDLRGLLDTRRGTAGRSGEVEGGMADIPQPPLGAMNGPKPHRFATDLRVGARQQA
jgi:hypothetical protein